MNSLPHQHHFELVLAPTGILLPRLLDGFHLLMRPASPPTPLGGTRPIFQAGEVLRIVTALPPVEGRPAEPEVAPGKGSVMLVLFIVVEPLETSFSLSGQDTGRLFGQFQH
jgi:hypothetical protein